MPPAKKAKKTSKAKPKKKPTKKPKPKPIQFATPNAGVDRSTIDLDRKGSGGNGWWQELYKNSNFSFIGVYLNMGPIAPNVAADYSTASGNVGKHWTREFPNIKNQGWGFAFFYTGYSSGFEMIANGWPRDDHKFVRPPANINETLAAERGILHARHIKTIVQGFGSDSAGSVVYVDNEDHGIRDKWLWKYYDAMFEEMRKPGPGDLPAVRPGMYGTPIAIGQAMPNNLDLFVWLVKVDQTIQNLWSQPNNTIAFDMAPFPMLGFKWNKDKDVMVSVGRQGRIDFGGRMPNPDLPNLRGNSSWDFDMSFVRDPRYPVANPRLRQIGTVLIRGVFRKVDQTNPQVMVLREASNPNAQDIGGDNVEPEAPIFLTNLPELFTINTSGQITSSVRATDGTWKALTAIPKSQNQPDLRRIRAFTISQHGPFGRDLFYISTQRHIIGRRRPGTEPGSEPWSEPARMGKDVLVHPFSEIVCTSDDTGVNVFFIAEDGILQVATWVSKDKIWPGNRHRRLQKNPTLLLGTAMSVAIPSSRQQAIFAIGKDLRLNIVIFTEGSGWSPVIPLGDVDKDKLFCHSRLAAKHTSDSVIRVAAISQLGDPCIFTVTLNGNSAVAAKTIHEHHAQGLPAGGEVLLAKAGGAAGRYYDINPFGDLTLDMVGTDLTLTCVGARPGVAGMLQKKVDAVAEWTLLVQ